MVHLLSPPIATLNVTIVGVSKSFFLKVGQCFQKCTFGKEVDDAVTEIVDQIFRSFPWVAIRVHVQTAVWSAAKALWCWL